MSVGANIKKRRKQLGMNAETLAEILHVSPSTIYRYESGDIEKVDAAKLIPIAEALKTTPAYLMGLENDEAKDKLHAIGHQLTAPSRSKEWKALSEGFERMEQQRYDEFMAIFNMLKATKPEYFNEGNDDDDPES